MTAMNPQRRTHSQPGTFIVLEGIDGCGSTTQSRRLVHALQARGHDAMATFEPSSGPIGQFLRGVLERRPVQSGQDHPFDPGWATLSLLFAADRLDHVDSTILPALRAGRLVISDRYDLSSLAYQSVTADDASAVVPWIRELNAQAVRPDLTLVLEVSAEEAAERRRRRGTAEQLFEAEELQRRLIPAYASAQALVPGDRLEHVSGVGYEERVTERLLAVVLAAFPNL